MLNRLKLGLLLKQKIAKGFIKNFTKSFIMFLVFSNLNGVINTEPAYADWRQFDSPNFITNGNPDYIASVVKAGDILQYVSFSLMLLYPLAMGDWVGLEQGLITYGASVGSVNLLKTSFNRQRPNGADFGSMPSGHAAATMAPAAFIQVRYGFSAAMPFWAIGVFTAYSRVAGRRHFITDTLVSTGIAIGFAYLFTTPYHSEKNSDLMIYPQSYETGGGGLALHVKF